MLLTDHSNSCWCDTRCDEQNINIYIYINYYNMCISVSRFYGFHFYLSETNRFINNFFFFNDYFICTMISSKCSLFTIMSHTVPVKEASFKWADNLFWIMIWVIILHLFYIHSHIHTQPLHFQCLFVSFLSLFNTSSKINSKQYVILWPGFFFSSPLFVQFKPCTDWLNSTL